MANWAVAAGSGLGRGRRQTHHQGSSQSVQIGTQSQQAKRKLAALTPSVEEEVQLLAGGKQRHPDPADTLELNELYNRKGSRSLGARNHSSFESADGTDRQSLDLVPNVSRKSTSTSAEHNCELCGCEVIRINISGATYELRQVVLNKHPETLLGNRELRKKYYCKERDEYFFDRYRPAFEPIFNYYMYGGKLRKPPDICEDIFLEELDFYQIDSFAIEQYRKDEGYVDEVIVLPENLFMRKLWMLFEFPETSKQAFAIGIISIVATLLSIVLFCVETLPVISQSGGECIDGDKPNFGYPFFILETICSFWFTFELIIRLIASPSKCAFFKDIKNWVDIFAVLPYYWTLGNTLITMSCKAQSTKSLAFLRVVRLVRVFKLTKHSSGLQVLILTFKASAGGLFLFCCALFVCMLLFSSVIYYCEVENEKTTIQSIPGAFWWAVITMCTVGYGDQVPVGALGKIVGSICALTGVLTLAIPVPIISENFNKFYAHRGVNKNPEA